MKSQFTLLLILLLSTKLIISSDYEKLFICRPHHYETDELLEKALD